MRKIVVNKKTGFKVSNPYMPLIIRDQRGKLFYDNESRIPKVRNFNLPKGIYYVDKGYINPLERPVNYQMPKLPKKQRNRKFPFHFKSVFADNPNKCTIHWNLNTIVFDHALKEMTLPELYFILFHEFAHAKYSNEDLADLGSAYLMLKHGFNPSQIVKAPIDSLSSKQIPRKTLLYYRLLNSRYES